MKEYKIRIRNILFLLLIVIGVIIICNCSIAGVKGSATDDDIILNIIDDDHQYAILNTNNSSSSLIHNNIDQQFTERFTSIQQRQSLKMTGEELAEEPVSNNSSLVCPFILYANHWKEYQSDSKNRNSKFNSKREELMNERIFLFNQTEWSLKFPEQKSPLACPILTKNAWRRYVPMVNPSENILYYLGEELEYCKSYDKWTFEQKFLINGTIVTRNVTQHFNFAQVCDRLFCFSKTSLDLVKNEDFKYGLNFTELITNTSIYQNMFPQRVALRFLEKWAISFDDDLNHDVDPQTLNVSPQLNRMMHTLLPHLPYNFTNLKQISQYYTACTICRDYNKNPILPGRDVCIAIDFPFECNYGSKGSLSNGYPLTEIVSRKNSIFRNEMNMTAEPLCYCPRPGSIVVNKFGNDVIISDLNLFSTKTASQCDVFTQFWYPLYDSKFLSIILVMLEIVLNSLLFLIVLVPLMIQFIKEVSMKIRGRPFKIPKLRILISNHGQLFSKLIERNLQAKNSNKSTELSNSLFMYTTSAYNKRSWKRVLFDLRVYSALALQMGYICYLASDILGASSNIDSPTAVSTTETVMFLTGTGFTCIGTMPILAMWVDVMKKTENNSERISLKISMPLFIFMTFGVCGIISYAITDYYSSFFASAVFMLCLVVIFICVIFGLFIYGFRIYWNMRKVSRINFFQYRFTKFLVAASIFAIFPAFHMIFDIATKIYQSQHGLYPSNRFYYLYSPFITSVFLLAFGSSLIYVLFPSMKLLSESYRLLVYCTVCCCGKSPRVKQFLKRHQEYREEYENPFDNMSESGSVQVGRLPYLATKSQKALKSIDEATFDNMSINLNHSTTENNLTTGLVDNSNNDYIQVDDSMYYENQIQVENSPPKSQKQKELSQPLL